MSAESYHRFEKGGALIDVTVVNQQDCLSVDDERLRDVVAAVLEREGVRRAAVNIAVVDNATIHDLNRRHLAHDYPTDVLSFQLESGPDGLEGEVVVSAETALAAAAEFGWGPLDELLLYVIHGVLHLVGYDDQDDAARTAMREREREHLLADGVRPPAEPRRTTGPAASPARTPSGGKVAT